VWPRARLGGCGKIEVMERGVGEEGLGKFARLQVEAARRDPRPGRKRGAMIADFWDAVEEAERVRMLAVWGLHELAAALEREEEHPGASRDDKTLPEGVRRTLQAAWERAEMARVEISNGAPHLNAQALISMNSALDALVEEWVPSIRALRIRWMSEQMYNLAAANEPRAARHLPPDVREKVMEAMQALVEAEVLPKLEALRGRGAARYETALAQEGLGAPEDRPIPDDLDDALAELGALRDVLIHRSGRIDDRALQQAPS
jgi:hypothetical protein